MICCYAMDILHETLKITDSEIVLAGKAHCRSRRV